MINNHCFVVTIIMSSQFSIYSQTRHYRILLSALFIIVLLYKLSYSYCCRDMPNVLIHQYVSGPDDDEWEIGHIAARDKQFLKQISCVLCRVVTCISQNKVCVKQNNKLQQHLYSQQYVVIIIFHISAIPYYKCLLHRMNHWFLPWTPVICLRTSLFQMVSGHLNS